MREETKWRQRQVEAREGLGAEIDGEGARGRWRARDAEKWHGGGLYKARGLGLGGLRPFRSRSISIGRPGAEGVR